MRIAVIGPGHVGAALGTGWAKAGHAVIFGAREPKAPAVQELLQHTEGKAQSALIPEAIAEAEIVALAIPWGVVGVLLKEIAPCLTRKILIDCTNPTKEWPALDHREGSGGEQVAQLIPEAYVVKAFNTTGFENMRNPKYGDLSASMFYAGDNAEAKKVVHGLAADLGFDPVDIGDLSQAHTLELLASLWGTLAYKQRMGRNIAFRLLTR